jgi:cytochrome c peroxidase
MYKLKVLIVAVFAASALLFFASDRGSTTVVKGGPAGAVPSAPTGVNASDNDYANKVGILWDTMRGATIYRIFRNTLNDPNSATEVGTSVSNTYYDTTATPGAVYFYWVRAESAGGNSPFSAVVQGRRGIAGESPGPFTPLEPAPAPAGNPVTAAKAALGKALFWDEQLSSTNTVSCGTCHRPAEGGSDPRSIIGDIRSINLGPNGVLDIPGAPRSQQDDIVGSPGVPKNNLDGTYTASQQFGFRPQVTGRKSPSYLNAGYSQTGLFWDGRATDEFRDPLTNQVILPAGGSLESQVLGPPMSDVEMAHGGRNWGQAAERIESVRPLALASKVPASLANFIDGRTYSELFEEAFGTPEVTPARIAMAIATHERQLITDRTPFDRWAAGMGGLTQMEENGSLVFIGKQCNQCHMDAIFSDNFFHNIGVRPPSEDRGRGAVTNDPKHDGQFKTPTLRNVELHGPFMHNGKFQTLEEVVTFYNVGGHFDAPNIDRGVIRPMAMTPMEQQTLAAFMKRPMTDPRVRDELPPFDRPQLYTESNRVPVISGTGRAGNAGVVPTAVAIEPPLVGNPSFTVAVGGGLGAANATLVIGSTDPGVGTSVPTSGSFAFQQLVLSAGGDGSVSLAIPNNAALVGQTFHGRWYIADPSAANGFSVSRLFSFTIFGEAASKPAFVDFDGDRKSDISIFRPNGGQWWWSRSSDNVVNALQFGAGTDKVVPADYTGDGKTDVAMWRPASGEWFVLRSEDNTYYAYAFGTAGDIPAPGDFDGDGMADTAVFRPSNGTWYIRQSSGPVRFDTFGAPGDIPQVGDYDNDGKADLAIFRPSGTTGAEWWINRSTAGVFATQFGLSTDKPVAADYTGDGKTDIAFFRPTDGFWYISRSEDLSFYSVPFGAVGDIPAPGDFDGDGKTDLAVFRGSTATWYINRSSSGLQIATFGATGDVPVQASYVP